MTTYNIRTTSWPIWILTLFITLGVFGIFIWLTGMDNIAVTMGLMLGFALASFYFQRFTSRGEVQISITKTNIEIKYLKQPILSNKPDRVISLTDIESYKYQPDKNFDLFKLTLKDQTELYFYHYSSFTGDDFAKLVIDFPKLAATYNRHKEKITFDKTTKEHHKQTGVIREKTIFEGKTGLFLAGIAIFFITIFIYLMATNQVKASSGGVGLVASISGATFFLGQYFKYRNKKD